MSAAIIDFGRARQDRGLPSVSRVDPVIALLPDEGKRVGDRVRCSHGEIATVVSARRSERGFILALQTTRGICCVGDDTVEALSHRATP